MSWTLYERPFFLAGKYRQQPWTSYIIWGNKNGSQAGKSSKISLGLCFVSLLYRVRSRIGSRFSPVFLTSKIWRPGRYFSSHCWLEGQNQEIFWCQRGSGVSERNIWKNKRTIPKMRPCDQYPPPWFFYRKTLAAKKHSITWGRGIPHPPNWTDRVCIWGWYDPLQLFKSKTSDSQVSKWTGPERWHRTSW